MSVTIALLGEVTARIGDEPVELGPPRQRCVLAALAVDAGRLVPSDRVMARVWGATTPRRGRATLHSHVSRLRGAFAGALAVVHRADGYVLAIDQPAHAVDLLRFRALCDDAGRAGDDTRAVALLTEALALWRGEPLAGLSGEWADGERDRWRQERWIAEQDLIDAQLRTGHGGQLVARLAARTTRRPLDERVAGQYMLALYRAGRPADALAHYQRLRERLAEELGTDPGAAVRELHQRILTADPGLLTPQATTEAESVVLPRQLPAAPAPFVGRGDELDRLDATLSAKGHGAPPATASGDVAAGRMMLISAIGGAGGLGKTWLVLHWAHRHLSFFPDGQLFADLRGFSPAGRPSHPADVLGGFLEALGVDRDRQPNDPDRRAELYRSMVADKRMLIVLDNAATTDQVTPLLPGGRHCTVLVTSRNRLRGLTARHGARPLHLDVLPDTEAHALLSTTVGSDRAATEAPAMAELVELCGGFPLALGVIASRAATDRHLPLGDIVTELRALGVDALDFEDPSASLPKVLSWSLHQLTHEQRIAFALLGSAPGADIGLPAAGHLIGVDDREAHGVLQALVDASLVDRTPGGRYAMHDLVRAYAATIADELPAEVHETALRRVCDFYAGTAAAADRLLYPHREVAPLDPLTSGAAAHPLPDAAAALAWLDVEHPCLLATQQTAARHQWHSTVWHVAWSLLTFHYRRGHRHDDLAAWQAAAEAATHLPDPGASVLAQRCLGLAHAELGHHEVAIDHLHRALALAERHRLPIHQAHTHHSLGWAWEQRGDYDRALRHARRALDLFRGLDLPVREARALNAVGWCAARLGDYDTARAHCQAALELHRQHRHPDSEAAALDSLGYIDHHSGRHRQAIDHYREALALHREHKNTYQAAGTLDRLGHPLATLGELDAARAVWRESLRLYREQGRHEDAIRVQRQLDELDGR